MTTSSSRVFVRTFLLLCLATPAVAQIGPAATAMTIIPSASSVRGQMAFDPVNRVFLVVSNDLRFVNEVGQPLGSPFAAFGPIAQGGVVEYSRDLNAGNGGFLVAGVCSGGGVDICLSTVAYPGGVIASNRYTQTGSTATVSSLAYSATSKQFALAVNIHGGAVIDTLWIRHLDLSLAVIGSSLPLGGVVPCICTATVAWNPTTDEYGVAFRDSHQVASFARALPNGAVPQFGARLAGPSGLADNPEIAFNPITGGWLAVWYQTDTGGATVFRSAEIDAAGKVLANHLVSTALTNASSYTLAYNPGSGTFLVGGSDRFGSGTIAGFELDAHGLRIGPAGVALNVGGNVAAASRPFARAIPGSTDWGMVFSDNGETSLRFQRVVTLTPPFTTIQPPASPAAAIDSPANGSPVLPSFTLTGWAIDTASLMGPGVDGVFPWAFPTSGAAPFPLVGASTYGIARTDVAANYGYRFLNSGYTFKASNVPPGTYSVVIFVHDTVANAFYATQSVALTVQPALLGAIDSPGPGSVMPPPNLAASAVITGWAIDADAASGSGIDSVWFWAFPASGDAPFALSGAIEYGLTRRDVETQYGSRFRNSGYRFTVSGGLADGQSYRLLAFGHSVVSGWRALQSVDVTISQFPEGAIDLPDVGATAEQPVTLTGWAWDVRDTSGTGVDAVYLWAFPIDGGAPFPVNAVATYGLARVGFARDVGFRVTISGLSQGTYIVVVYAHDTVVGGFYPTQSVVLTLMPFIQR